MAPLTSILFVIDNLEFGGGERGFLQLIESLAGEGGTVSVAAHPGGLFEVQARAAGAEFVAMDMRARAGVTTIARLRRLVRSGRFAVVHSQGARADFFARMAVWAVPDVRLVSTIQMPVDGFGVDRLRGGVYRFFDRLARPRVDRFIVVSGALRRQLVQDWGVPPARVALVHNGVETERLPPSESGEDGRRLRRELGLPEHVRIVGGVGRLVWQKGFEHLLAATAVVLAQVPDVWLAIVGDGPRRGELLARAQSLGLTERVRFLGFRSDVPSLLRGFDVLAVPSLLEGFPMITLEAMALGVPIVATAIDGIVEQLDHEGQALLVPPGEPAALSRALVTLLKDTALARRFGAAARHRAVAAFDVSRAVAATRRVYAELVSGAPAGQPVR
ncbi:MAG TPA: glycosyltransferase family 4 protein [Methylomirabilota bacterium]|nr:glycosyltransferase family 4 protein [Methylomirabilota bacterium]